MATEEELKNEQNINNILNERVGINEELVSEQQDIANVILDQVKNLEFAKIEQAKLRSITRDLSKTAQQNYSLSLNELGTKKGIKKLEDDRARVAENIRNLQQISVKDLGVTKQLQKDIQDSINFQVQKAAQLDTELENVQDTSQVIANNLGVKTFGGLQKVVKSIPGLKGLSKPFDDAAQASLESAQQGEKSALAFAKGANAFIDSAGLAIGFTSILNSLFAINKAQTDFRRLTGQSVDVVDTLNDSLITTVDFIQQASALTRQFGFNATAAFDSFNIQEAAELEQLMGLTAEEAGNLALFAQTFGQNANTNTNELIKQVGELNVANKSAVSQKAIFQDIGNISKATALTFQGNALEIGKAAQNARILGLNLSQVDRIAGNLLDIESSIAAEFEAEVISGRQLNLEQARFFALTNDLDGLTSELVKNQSALQGFVNGTRIEQEAIAGALGMSRDEMADMVFQQRAQLNITDEQARKTAGLTEEDFKRLTIQESISKSVAKLTEALAGPVEAFAAMADNSLILYSTIGLIAATSLARMISSVITLGVSFKAAAAASGAMKAFLSPAGLILSLSALALVGAGIAAASKAATKTGDAILPASGGPIVSTMEGGIFQGTRNDDVLMGPGLARGGRNQGLSKGDIDLIANAVKQGASGAQINLDGARVSNRIQPPLAVNTRKYSV